MELAEALKIMGYPSGKLPTRDQARQDYEKKFSENRRVQLMSSLKEEKKKYQRILADLSAARDRLYAEIDRPPSKRVTPVQPSPAPPRPNPAPQPLPQPLPRPSPFVPPIQPVQPQPQPIQPPSIWPTPAPMPSPQPFIPRPLAAALILAGLVVIGLTLPHALERQLPHLRFWRVSEAAETTPPSLAQQSSPAAPDQALAPVAPVQAGAIPLTQPAGWLVVRPFPWARVVLARDGHVVSQWNAPNRDPVSVESGVYILAVKWLGSGAHADWPVRVLPGKTTTLVVSKENQLPRIQIN